MSSSCWGLATLMFISKAPIITNCDDAVFILLKDLRPRVNNYSNKICLQVMKYVVLTGKKRYQYQRRTRKQVKKYSTH